MTDTHDLVVIASGPAGERAAELTEFFSHRSAVIEKARPGRTATTRGGSPTSVAARIASGSSRPRSLGSGRWRFAAEPEREHADDHAHTELRPQIRWDAMRRGMGARKARLDL